MWTTDHRFEGSVEGATVAELQDGLRDAFERHQAQRDPDIFSEQQCDAEREQFELLVAAVPAFEPLLAAGPVTVHLSGETTPSGRIEQAGENQKVAPRLNLVVHAATRAEIADDELVSATSG